jgi:hypothetical protein
MAQPATEAPPPPVVMMQLLFGKQLFASSGFRLGRIVPTSRPISVIEALPV